MSEQPNLFGDAYALAPVLTCAHGSDWDGPTPCCEAEAERVETAYEAAQPAPVTPYAQHQADGASAHPLSVFEAIKED